MDEFNIDEHVDSLASAPAPASPPAADLPYELVVVGSFAGYSRGDVITDPDEVQQVLESEHAAHVVKRSKPA